MAVYVKRFESISVEEDIESCKDIIETMVEYEDEIKVSNYEIGYYGGEFKKKPEKETDKKSLSFFISLVKEEDRDLQYSSHRPVTADKSDFDNVILLLQKSKSLFSKLKIYCTEIKFSINLKKGHFILLFENTNDSEKKDVKINRVYKSVNKAFDDYTYTKTIYFSSNEKEYQEKYINLFNEIVKTLPDEEKERFYNISFRFTLDISLDGDVVTLKPKTFRYKFDNNTEWKSIRSNRLIITDVNKFIINSLQSKYSASYSDVKLDTLDITGGDTCVKVHIK